MKFGVLAGNSHINSRIYRMFEELHPSDPALFARKFKTVRDDERFHTFRELIIGAKFRRQGFDFRYEHKVLGKTPDWVSVDESGQVQEILDVVTLHQRRETETDMVGTLSTGEVWTGWVTIPPDHIYSKIEQKANAYSGLVGTLEKPYVVCLFGEFTACVDPEEVQHVLYSHHGGVFANSPMLAGVIYFVERSGTYDFSHFPNPAATYPSALLHAI
ncbi:hypothetical protein [Roseateles sp. P5_D6]